MSYILDITWWQRRVGVLRRAGRGGPLLAGALRPPPAGQPALPPPALRHREHPGQRWHVRHVSGLKTPLHWNAADHLGLASKPPTQLPLPEVPDPPVLHVPSPAPDQQESGVPGRDCDCMAMEAEVAAQLAGMRDTLTGLTRRLQMLETSRVSAPCVATRQISDYFPVSQYEWRETGVWCRQAAGMPGMDAWCGENCARSNCPPHLCSCPHNNSPQK